MDPAVLPVQWNWSFICPTGLKPWTVQSPYQLAPCFQQIFFQLPVLTMFAILSAYQFGRRYRRIIRNSTQIRFIQLRIVAILVLVFYPIFKMYYLISHHIHVWPIDILIGGFEIIAFSVHCGSLLSLRKYGGSLTHRGSLFCGVIWIAIFLLTAVWITTDVAANIWPWSIVPLVMHGFYAVSLLPAGQASFPNRFNIQQDDVR